ncbi:MAG: GspMb/PilO family protein [Kiritimatiellia bacterium]
MIASNLPRNQRALLAIVGVIALYGLAALLWFSGRQEAWNRSRKNYEKALKQMAAENRMISQRETWRERLAAESLKMPVAEEGESTQTRWQRVLERIAADHGVSISSEQPKPEEEHGKVWEMPIEVKYEAALGKLVEFLHALNTAEGAMLDVRELEISTKNNGWLSGKFTLTCAYVKEAGASSPAPSAGAAKKGSGK